jgi:hypothetical protein
MLNPIIDSIVALLTLVVGHDWGTGEFYVVTGITVFAVLLVFRLLAGLFGSKRGIVVTSVAVLFPVSMGLIAYGSAEAYGQPKFEAASFAAQIPWVACGLLVVGSIVMVTKRLLDLNFIISVIIFTLSLAAGVAAFGCSGVIVDFLSKSSNELEKREVEIIEKIPDAA